MPSRIADNLFWLGRYLERADSSARLLRAVTTRMTGESNPSDVTELPVLVRALALTGQIDPGYAIREFPGKLPPLEFSLPNFSLDHQDPDSLRCQVDQVVMLAGSVRDRLSSDAWRIVREMGSNLRSSSPENCDLMDLLHTIDTLLVSLAAFSGFVSEFMTRTHGYHFLNIGRRLERSLNILGLVKNCLTYSQAESSDLLEAILEVSDSRLTYRSRYFANLELPAVLDLLLADPSNPRSLAYQVQQLDANLNLLPGNASVGVSTNQRLAGLMIQTIGEADFFQMNLLDGDERVGELKPWLTKLEQQLPKISTSISNRFFVHSGPVNQIVVEPVDAQS